MLFLVRHGETAWNVAGRYQGAKDSGLTERGKRQAASAGRVLARLTPHAVGPLCAYVSPLGRAQGTAAIMADYLRLRLCSEPRIAEVSIGAWDGLTDFEIESEYPGALDGADAFDWYFRAPGGEPMASAIGRVTSWLAEAERPAVAISHGLTSRIIRGVYLGLSPQEMLTLPTLQNGLYVLQDEAAEFIGYEEAQ